MDFAKAITHVSLCTGYGGIDLGLKRAIPNLRTIAYSEIEGYAVANLVAKIENGLLDTAPIWTNLKTFPWAEFRGKVHILSGGYPCQPFSNAGKRLGKDDPRHLWPFIANGIRLMRPEFCFFENVEGHITLGLREVIGELEQIGYDTTWGIFSASEVGATHRRKRMFILAYSKSFGIQRLWPDWFKESYTHVQQKLSMCSSAWPARPNKQQYQWEPPRVLGNSYSRGRGKSGNEDSERKESKSTSTSGDSNQHKLGNPSSKGRTRGNKCGAMAGLEKVESLAESNVLRKQQGQCEAQSSVGGNTDGSSNRLDHAELYQSIDNRTDELRLLGNGVVPATATLAFTTLWERIK